MRPVDLRTVLQTTVIVESFSKFKPRNNIYL